MSSLFGCGRLSWCFRKMAERMNQARAEEIVQNVDNFLFDCDGVLWDGNGVIEGSLDTVLKLKKLGKKVYYVTNNSSQSRESYVEKCKKYGYPAQENEIVCTAYVAAQFLRDEGFKDKVYLIGREESIGYELGRLGIKYIGTGPDPVVGNDYKDWLEYTKLDPEVKCVLVGFDPHISYMKLMKAASYLMRPDCLFVATNEDAILPVRGGTTCIPGTGCMVLPVKLASSREPEIMGKPSTHMFEILRKAHDLDPARSMMTGDRISTDMVFGQKCGMRSFLVLSGICSSDDVRTRVTQEETEEMKSGQPDYYAQNLAELGQFI